MKKWLLLIPIILVCLIPVYQGCDTNLLPVDNLDLKIDCPTTYSVGELLVLDASGSKIKDLEWVIFPSTANFSVNGKRAYFSSSDNKTYTVVLSGTDGTKIDCLVIELKSKVQVGPEVAEEVVIDEYTEKIRLWLPTEYTKVDAYKLAQSFRSIGAISAANFNDLEAMILATVYSNKVALGDNLEAWKMFLDKVQEDLSADPPASIAECAKRWDKIANALERLMK